MNLEQQPNLITEESVGSVETESEDMFEAQRRAEKTILETLEMDIESGLDNFQEKLVGAVKSLPRYADIEQKLAKVPNGKLAHELFRIIKKSEDKPISPEKSKDTPIDGVLIKSMRQGKIECAGRTMIASIFLQERGVDHSVVSGIGHSFVIAEIDPDTLAYVDANENLYFTFPKPALNGYKGTTELAECKIEDYIPRGKDVIDGLGAAQDTFIAMPAAEGVARQYLNNVSSALRGNKEFIKSGIPVDEEAGLTVRKITEKLFGKNKFWDEFHSSEKFGKQTEMHESQLREAREKTQEIIDKHLNKKEFVDTYSSFLQSDEVGGLFVYLKNASESIREENAEKMWDLLRDSKNLEKLDDNFSPD